jgi:hypothetical protein
MRQRRSGRVTFLQPRKDFPFRSYANPRKRTFCAAPGLPDGLFSYQKYQFGYILGVLKWKMLVYFITIWNILRLFSIHTLWPFGIVCVHLVYFPTFLVYCVKKNLATLAETTRRSVFFCVDADASVARKLSRQWIRNKVGGK